MKLLKARANDFHMFVVKVTMALDEAQASEYIELINALNEVRTASCRLWRYTFCVGGQLCTVLLARSACLAPELDLADRSPAVWWCGCAAKSGFGDRDAAAPAVPPHQVRSVPSPVRCITLA